jgi:anionic cell wall polymer biosynthesis LytR-Cps2A-Psr (LCP) family protein
MKYMDISKQKNIQTIASSEKRSGGGFIFVLACFLVLGILGYIFRGKLLALFNPITIIGSGGQTASLKETDGRTNIMILGSDHRDAGVESGHALTDTILIASVSKTDNSVVLISIPRDLWVQRPDGGFSKINAIYETCGFNGLDPKTGQPLTDTIFGNLPCNGKGLGDTVEQVLGMPVHYYGLVSFDLFTQTIDILGGVNVTVANSFTDTQYPIEVMEDATCGLTQDQINSGTFPACRYKTIHFDKGVQKMDGVTALEFVRSRHGDNNEGTDFARSRRQQEVITAVKEQVLSAQTLLNPSKLKELYDTYAKNVETNIDFKTIQAFAAIAKQVDFKNVTSVVLDDRSDANTGGLLYAPTDTTLYGGQYVLVPKTGDYSQIHAYVQKYLFGSGDNANDNNNNAIQ